MSSDLFTAAGQKRLREIVGGAIPSAKAGHVAEAVAAGWGFRNHAALLTALGEDILPQGDFDPALCMARLESLGASMPAARDHVIHLLWAATRPIRESEPATPEPLPQRAVLALQLGSQAARKGEWNDAGAFALEALRTGNPDQKKKAFSLLDAASEKDDIARLNKAVALGGGDGVPRDADAATELLRPFCDHQDPELAMTAHANLGDLASARGKPQDNREAVEHWEEAARRGNRHCAFNAGLFLQHGKPGVPQDLERARAMYQIGIDLGDTSSMANMAGILQKEDPEETIRLLERAAELGHEKAGVFLEMTERMATSSVIGGSGPGDPQPQRIVPKTMKRPRLVADALAKGIDFARKDAEHLTAMLHGFLKWDIMARAAVSEPASPTDEDLPPDMRDARLAWQRAVLLKSTNLSPTAAEVVLELLAPTSGKGKPSLRNLERRLEMLEDEEDDDRTPFSSRTIRDGLARLLGMDPDDPSADPMSSLDALRTLHPVQPEVWLAALEQLCGWTIVEPDLEAETNGSRVGWVVAGGNRQIPIFMSSIAFVPGDPDDAQEQAVKRRIERGHGTAVLLFNRVTGWTESGKDARGVVYGGQFLMDGTWSHFVIRRDHGGFDDVIAQRGLLDGKPGKEFLERFGETETATVLLATSIAAYLAGEEPGQRRMSMIQTASGWWNPL